MRIKTMQELRYEKAKMMIELINLEHEIRVDVKSFFHMNLMQSASLGFGIFSSNNKWSMLFETGTKVWGWASSAFKKYRQKNGIKTTAE